MIFKTEAAREKIPGCLIQELVVTRSVLYDKAISNISKGDYFNQNRLNIART
jgi:hypothetical protein